MERRARWLWWAFLLALLLLAAWKLFLPHGTKAYLNGSSGGREIVVYVTGAVAKSSLLHLPLEARLDDALKQIQPLPEANLAALNPAEKLKDGQKISVPFKPGAAAQGTAGAGQSAAESAQGGAGSSQVAAGSSQGVAESGTGNTIGRVNAKIDINTAASAELDKLPGIGPALAERIVQYRTEHGPFAGPEDLEKVSGIGPKTYERLADWVVAGP